MRAEWPLRYLRGMGTVQGTRADGSAFSKRVTSRTTRLMIREPLVSARIEGVADAPGLEVFEIGTHDVPVALESVAPLTGLAQLREVALTLSAPVDLGPLRACPALRALSLRVAGKEPIDLRALAAHPGLESVSLGGEDQLALDLSPLADLPALKRVWINGGEWRALDLSALRGKPLEHVAIDRGYLTEVDLDAIATPALRSLSLMNQELERLVLLPLERCVHLGQLLLGGNEMEWLDVTGVAKHASLRHVDWPNVKDIFLDEETDVRAPALAHLRS